MILTQDTPAATCLRYTPRAHVSHHGCVSGALGDLTNMTDGQCCFVGTWTVNLHSWKKPVSLSIQATSFHSFIHLSVILRRVSFPSPLFQTCVFFYPIHVLRTPFLSISLSTVTSFHLQSAGIFISSEASLSSCHSPTSVCSLWSVLQLLPPRIHRPSI